MINALPTALTVRLFTIAVILLCAAVVGSTDLGGAGRVVRAQGLVVLGVNVLLLLLTWGPAFRLLHKITLAERWWFPLLDGKWETTIWSNWPQISATLTAARGDAPRYDPLTQEPPGAAAPPVIMEAEIKSSLFGIEIVMEVPHTKRRSQSVFVRPQWCKPSLPQLTYVYEQVEHGRVPVTDTLRHFGAGVLTYYSDCKELRGEYWTQRQGSKGLNTAGSLTLRRIK